MSMPRPKAIPHKPVSGFVNQGYFNWLQQRKEWTKPTEPRRVRVRAVTLDVERVVRATRGNRRTLDLGKAVPLVQMVDILNDVWEYDGLFS